MSEENIKIKKIFSSKLFFRVLLVSIIVIIIAYWVLNLGVSEAAGWISWTIYVLGVFYILPILIAGYLAYLTHRVMRVKDELPGQIGEKQIVKRAFKEIFLPVIVFLITFFLLKEVALSFFYA